MGQSVTRCFEIIVEKDIFCYYWFLLNHPCNFKQTQGDECLWETIKQNFVMKESIKVRQGAAGFNYSSQSREVIWASLPGCNIGFFSKVHVVTELRWWYFSVLFFFLEKSSHFVSFVCFCVCLQMTGSCLWMSSRPSSLMARWTRKNWRSFLTPSTRITPGQQRHATAVFVCRSMGWRCVSAKK